MIDASERIADLNEQVNIEARFSEFWIRVNKTESCWEWTGPINHSGYGACSRKNGSAYAHRSSWIMFNGEIPDQLCVLHKCDNPICVNPQHLFLGTHQDNVRDKTMKGRAAKGERNSGAKLKTEDVLKIRKLAGFMTDSNLSLLFKVSASQIARIRHRTKWKHI